MTKAQSVRPFDTTWCRRQFPTLNPPDGAQAPLFLDGPAGSQVPQRVIDAMVHYLATMNANHGGLFATSRQSDALLEEAHRALADFLGTADPDTVAFGPNMTSLTLALSRAIARTWNPGDEVLVSRLDHDANVTPWVLAAQDAGASVRYLDIHADDCTLALADLARKLSPRTRLVAVGCASNAVGTINPIESIVRMAHDAGAQVFLDAVHYAPHGRLEVDRWDCDFLVCSAYKFFGPHVGVLWGRRDLLESLPAYKVRPAPDSIPGRWMTGTQSHEGIAGTLAAVEYLTDLGRQHGDPSAARPAALDAAYRAIVAYERQLAAQLLAGLANLPQFTVWGITDRAGLAQRVPTVAITHRRLRSSDVASYLADQNIYAWHGNFYALPLTEALGLEPDGMVRLGLLHYNTPEEIQRLLDALKALE